MAELAVTGYASLDYPVLLDGMVVPDRTTHILARDPDAWPRAGGSPAYVAAAATAGGISSAPVTWIGGDALGQTYLEHCRVAGLDVSAVDRRAGARSPVALMIHQSDGTTPCLYDPGFKGEEHLSDVQIAMIEQCAMLCVTVGPGHLIDAILRHRPADAPMCWVMKDDPTCFGPENRAALCDRASLVFCNTAERGLIGKLPRDGAMIVETRGPEGVCLHRGGEQTALVTKPVAVADPTGAGDSFAGAFIAGLMRGATPEEAAGIAMDAVTAMLRARTA